MKTGNKDSTCADTQGAKIGHRSLNRVRNILKLGNRVACSAKQSIPTADLSEFSQAPEAVLYQLEIEGKAAAGRVYANTTPLR